MAISLCWVPQSYISVHSDWHCHFCTYSIDYHYHISVYIVLTVTSVHRWENNVDSQSLLWGSLSISYRCVHSVDCPCHTSVYISIISKYCIDCHSSQCWNESSPGSMRKAGVHEAKPLHKIILIDCLRTVADIAGGTDRIPAWGSPQQNILRVKGGGSFVKRVLFGGEVRGIQLVRKSTIPAKLLPTPGLVVPSVGVHAAGHLRTPWNPTHTLCGAHHTLGIFYPHIVWITPHIVRITLQSHCSTLVWLSIRRSCLHVA